MSHEKTRCPECHGVGGCGDDVCDMCEGTGLSAARDGVSCTALVEELEEEIRQQEKRRDAYPQGDRWYHWHDGVSFGMKAALQHLTDSSSTITMSYTAPKEDAP